MQGIPFTTPLPSRIPMQLAPCAHQVKKIFNPVLPYIKAYAVYALRCQLPISAIIVLGRAIKHRYYDPKALTEYSWKKAVSELFKGTICPLGPLWIFRQSMNWPEFESFAQASDEAVTPNSKGGEFAIFTRSDPQTLPFDFFKENYKIIIDDITNRRCCKTSKARKQFMQRFAEWTEWPCEFEEIATTWERHNPKFPLVNAWRIAYRLKVHIRLYLDNRVPPSEDYIRGYPSEDDLSLSRYVSESWKNIISLIKASRAVASEVPLKRTNKLSPQQLWELVKAGLWSDIKCYDKKGENILHRLAREPAWDKRYSTIVQTIHKKQGEHPNAFLTSKSKAGLTPLDEAASKNYQQDDWPWRYHRKTKALRVMLPLVKGKLTSEEAISVFNRIVEHTPLTFPYMLLDRFTDIIAAAKDAGSKQRLKPGFDALLKMINERLKETKLGCAKQAMAITAHETMTLFKKATGLELSLNGLDGLQKIWAIWEQPYEQVIQANNWAQLPTVLEKLTPKERAVAIQKIVLPTNFHRTHSHTFSVLKHMGVKFNNLKFYYGELSDLKPWY